MLRSSRTRARGRPEGRAGRLLSDVCPGEGVHESGLPEALCCVNGDPCGDDGTQSQAPTSALPFSALTELGVLRGWRLGAGV